MSAELVGSAHKIVHISPRVVLDDAIPIDVQFLDRPWRREAARTRHGARMRIVGATSGIGGKAEVRSHVGADEDTPRFC